MNLNQCPRLLDQFTGMTDYKFAFDSLGVFDSTEDMFGTMDAVLNALQANLQRAREELENEWITSLDLADTLERTQKVAFRIGHSFASLIVEQSRDRSLTQKNFPNANAQKLYTQPADKYQWKQNALPLDEATFRASLSPENMVTTQRHRRPSAAGSQTHAGGFAQDAGCGSGMVA